MGSFRIPLPTGRLASQEVTFWPLTQGAASVSALLTFGGGWPLPPRGQPVAMPPKSRDNQNHLQMFPNVPSGSIGERDHPPWGRVDLILSLGALARESLL